MTILFSSNTSWSLYIFRGDVMRALIQEGHRVVTAAPFDEYYSPQLQELGCRFIPLNISAKGTNPFTDIKLCMDYLHILKSEHTDFAFFYTIKPNIYGSIACRLKNIPHIAIVSGLGYTFINMNRIASISHFLYKLAFVSPKEVWFLNRDDYDAFLQKKLMSPVRAKIIPGEGINLDYFSPRLGKKPDEKFTFLLIARMLYDKGIREYYEAAKKIRQKFPQTLFLLLGEAGVQNPSAVNQETLREWEKNGVVKWIMPVRDVRPYIAESDCVVLPSYREGVPRTLMEAAAMEKPLIATDVPGCRDVVENGKTGYLCQSKNADSLAETMWTMLQLPQEDRLRMAVAGRKKMENEFNINLIIELYLAALREAEQHEAETQT